MVLACLGPALGAETVADPAAVAGKDSAAPGLVDLRDAVVLPGLMDMHVHLSMEFGVEGQRSYGVSDQYALDHRSAKDDAYFMVNAIVNARKTLEAGFTTVRNVGGDGWHIFALRDGIRDGALTPEEAIVTATVNAAALIGMGDELGTIEPGKIADLVAVAGDPLEDISVLKNVQVVIQGGRVVKNAR